MFCRKVPTKDTLSTHQYPSSIICFHLVLMHSDTDSDCQAGLSCFQRDDVESVPGCTGTGISGKDYCYNPNPERKYIPSSAYTPRITAGVVLVLMCAWW